MTCVMSHPYFQPDPRLQQPLSPKAEKSLLDFFDWIFTTKPPVPAACLRLKCGQKDGSGHVSKPHQNPESDAVSEPALRRTRKPSLAAALRQAAKLGKPVRGAQITADGVSLTFGEPEAQKSDNELDQWMASRARTPQRH